jgi:hypothetical protein
METMSLKAELTQIYANTADSYSNYSLVIMDSLLTKIGTTLKLEISSMPFSRLEESLQPRSTFAKFKESRWRRVVLIWACAASAVFLLNLVLVIWAETQNFAFPSTKANGSTRILYDGDCKTTKKLSTAAHFLINIFSSILLGGSSYGMQCLSAPTREEIDKAHAKSKWLDIGVLTVRNLRRINKKRVLLWCLLGFSSFPLHLL